MITRHRIDLEDGKIDQMPVVKNPADFDKSSGILLERIFFNYRPVVIGICLVMTLFLIYQASRLVLNAGFDKMLPQSHPYIKNYLSIKNQPLGLGNTIRISVENTQGDIFDPGYLDVLMKITDELFLLPGVDRAWMKSLWMPSVRWTMVTEQGYTGGPVMPDKYDGSPKSLEQLKLNIARAGIFGSLVAANYKSSMITLSVLETDHSGARLDYTKFSQSLENLRQKYESASHGKIKIHIVGFAKIVGDLIHGLGRLLLFFFFAVAFITLIVFSYTRCVRSTSLLILCSTLSVVWQLGIISLLGYELDPYAILVPFLIFAVSVSHGMQKMNGIMQDIGRGTHKYVAARYTFRRLFMAGLSAILANMFSFAILMLIDIPIIRDLAMTASIGVAIIVFTNLMLLPVLLSYTGVSPSAAERSLVGSGEIPGESGTGRGPIEKVLGFFDNFVKLRWAATTIAVVTVLAVIGIFISLHVKIGDLDPGVPELRPDSRYNLDNAFINENYWLSSDLFAVIVKTPPGQCVTYETLIESDRLAQNLRELPNVRGIVSAPDNIRLVLSGSCEGSPKWYSLIRNSKVLDHGSAIAREGNPDLHNLDASVMPITAYLTDHKAENLKKVVQVAADFSEKHSTKDRQFLLAAGSAGIEAATNMVVAKLNRTMMIYVYVMVMLFCFIAYRSWRAVVVTIIPLFLTTVLCESLMVGMGIGVKVATLPVIALGVGIGVDYALYLLSVVLSNMRAGLSLQAAYERALRFTGRVVALMGITMAGAVLTWAWSPIKFQADMGILLAFMFFYNMLGALILVPALSRFILGRTDEHGNVYLKEWFKR